MEHFRRAVRAIEHDPMHWQALADMLTLASEDILMIRDENGMGILHHVAKRSGCAPLLDAFLLKLRGLSPAEVQTLFDALDNSNRTPLSMAISQREEKTALILLENMSWGAIEGVDDEGWSCLAKACHLRLEEVALKLIERLPKRELLRVHRIPSLETFVCGFSRISAEECGDATCGGTAMHFAVRGNAWKVVKALLEHYDLDDLEIGDRLGRPAEALAALHGYEKMVRLFWENARLRNSYWVKYSRGAENHSNLRMFFSNYKGNIGDEFLERLYMTGDETLLRELLCCAVKTKWPELISAIVERLSQAAIDAPLPDGSTAACLCDASVRDFFIPLLQKTGPKSAAGE